MQHKFQAITWTCTENMPAYQIMYSVQALININIQEHFQITGFLLVEVISAGS